MDGPDSGAAPLRAGVDFALLGAIALPLASGLIVFRQGFSLLDDGLWLLGGRILAEGRRLYVDCPTIYGPARFALLVPFFAFAGKSALALALLKTIVTTAASGLGFMAARRLGAGRLAWLVPLGVLGLGPIDPRFVAAGGLALLVGRSPAGSSGRRAFGLGLAWGVLASFGVDAALFGGIILGGAAALSPECRFLARAWPRLAAGLALPLGLLALVGLVTGTLGEAVRQAIVFPLTGFRDAMGISWLKVVRGEAGALWPFAETFTGEKLEPLFPLHAPWRVLSVRCLYACVWLAAPAYFLAARRRARSAMGAAVVAFAATGILTLLGRGEVAHLKSCSLGALWLLPALLAAATSRPRARAALALVAGGLLFLPLIAETSWLALHTRRPQLRTWIRPTARIQMAGVWIDEIEALFAGLPGTRGAPMAIWPAFPGLHALMEVPPATPYVALLRRGEIRDPDAVTARLDALRTEVVLIGYSGYSYATSGLVMEQMEPRVWDYLRRNYRVLGFSPSERLRFMILQREPGGLAAIRALPLQAQLSDRGFSLANGVSPPLRPGVPVGQSFRAGSSGFGGLCVSFTGRPPQSVELRIAVWANNGARGFRRLCATTVPLSLRESPQVCCFPFESLPGTADRQLLVTIEPLTEPSSPLFLRWYQHVPGAPDLDFCPDGNAFVGGGAVNADLFFYSY